MAAVLGATCGEGRTADRSAPPAAVAPAAVSAAESACPWTLVYERTVGKSRDLYVIPAGGRPERVLTDDPAEESLPRWSRDGRFVYFTSNRSGNWQIYRVAGDGQAAPERLRTNPATEWQIEPSPDGKQVAFLSNEDGPESVYTMNLASGATQMRVRHGPRSILGNPSWSPEGQRLVFSSNWRIGHQIYLLDLPTGNVERLSGIGAGGCEPRFHPDGQHVIHVSRGHLSDKSRIVERDLRTGAVKTLVDWPALNYNPVYSPDASEIAFVSNITGDYVLYRQRLSDGKSWRMTFGPGSAHNPDYRPRP